MGKPSGPLVGMGSSHNSEAQPHIPAWNPPKLRCRVWFSSTLVISHQPTLPPLAQVQMTAATLERLEGSEGGLCPTSAWYQSGGKEEPLSVCDAPAQSPNPFMPTLDQTLFGSSTSRFAGAARRDPLVSWIILGAASHSHQSRGSSCTSVFGALP